jgi:hypothetical protein
MGLLADLLGGLAPDHEVIEAAARARRAGIRAGVITNSWGSIPTIPTIPTPATT